jgi:hydroxyacylglutathione hydrolase
MVNHMKEVEKVAGDLHLITQPFQGIFTGVTVVAGTDSVGVVDTGLETTPVEYILPLVSELGHRPEEINCIVNTHGHGDHIWGNKALREKTSAKIAVHELDAEGVGTVDVKLKDNDTIELGDREFRVVHTPGHTPGSICLYDEKDETLITGDSVQGRGVEEGNLVVRNKQEYINSMKKLLKLKIKTMIVDHPYRPFRRAVLTGEEPRQMIMESLKAVEQFM